MKKVRDSKTDNIVNEENIGTAEQQKEIKISDTESVAVLQKEIYLLKKNLDQAKAHLEASESLILEKDKRIKELTESVVQNKSQEYLQQYSQIFEKNDLKEIKSVGRGKQNDSKFILKIMSSLYKNGEKEKLQNRSMNGRKFKGEKKTEISFEKKKTMCDMLFERLSFKLHDENSNVNKVT